MERKNKLTGDHSITIYGTAVSILVGVVSAIVLSDPKDIRLDIVYGLIFGLLSEIIVLLIDIPIKIKKNDQIAETIDLIRSQFDKPGIKSVFDSMNEDLKKLSNGTFIIHQDDDVYFKDVRLIKHLTKGQDYFATVLPNNLEENLKSDSNHFKDYIEAQKLAVKDRHVNVVRLYFFYEETIASTSVLIQSHLKDLTDSGIKVFTLFNAKRINAGRLLKDFVIFHDWCVSWKINNGAEYCYNSSDILEYKRLWEDYMNAHPT